MTTARLRRIDPVWLVLALFGLCVLIVPTFSNVATTDDWGYSRPVEIFRDTHDLRVFPVVAATSVFQIVWGIAFSYIFGMSLGVMRFSTVVMSALGGIGLGWTLRQLGVSRGRAALGVGAYLFNPLQFILAFTFMTDAHFTALMILSVAFAVRSLAGDERADRAMIAASALAACAFLVRQQGVLIPIGIVLFLLLDRRLRPDRTSVVLLMRVLTLPVLAVAGYLIWLRLFNDVPDVQTGFLDEARAAGPSGAWTLIRHLTFIEVMYCGAFVLPITAAAAPLLFRMRFALRRSGIVVLALVSVGFLVEFWRSSNAGKHMPYVPQFVGAGGLGPADVRGSRARIIEQPWFDVATVVCAVSVIIAFVVLARAVFGANRRLSPSVGLIACVGLGQIAGILPPSFHYLKRGYSLDRYLLPLLPLAIVLLLWALRDVPIVAPLGWLLIAVMAIGGTMLTHDYLRFMETVWRAADSAVVAGAREDQVEAGAAWDGYHLYTDGLDAGVTRARTRGGPWWTYFYGKPTDSTYLVSSKPIKGYVIVGTYTFDTWLPSEDRVVYLLRKPSAPDLPALIDDR